MVFPEGRAEAEGKERVQEAETRVLGKEGEEQDIQERQVTFSFLQKCGPGFCVIF